MGRFFRRVASLITPVALSLLLSLPALGAAPGGGQTPLGMLVDCPDSEPLGPEAMAAIGLAEKTHRMELVRITAPGCFNVGNDKLPQLNRYQVLWYHQGDRTALPTAVQNPATLEALRHFVEQGGGLFVSGAALQLVYLLGVEPARPRVGGPGHDGYQAALIPQVTGHPVFAGLESQGARLLPEMAAEPIYLTSAGYPAFSDFHGSGGPKAGVLLARAASSAENPLVEYQLGKGRIIALGWRLPHYGLQQNAYRANLERLTQNILGYLADRRQWQPLRADGPAQSGEQSQQPVGIGENRFRALRMAVRDLMESFPDRYRRGTEYLERLAQLERAQQSLLGNGKPAPSADPARLRHLVEQFDRLQQEALLDNPLLDFQRLLVVERSEKNLGLPANWQSNSSLPTTGYENRLAILSPVGPQGELTTLFRPEGGRYVGQVDLHFDADRLLWSMPGSFGRFQVFEMSLDGSGLHELPLIHEPDVDNYDACYLPDGGVAFTSTAPFVGVPCVYGSSHATNLYRLDPDGTIRQLTVDQEHNWDPAVLNNGRLLYLRWEYTDLPHAHSRILFSMNPDGTNQAAYYGSNSYFPNAFFGARPVPGHPTMVVGVASGHHGVRRSGRLLLVDPEQGRHEAQGVVQEIPGYGRPVEAIIRDQLADGVWPQFLHPFPLS